MHQENAPVSDAGNRGNRRRDAEDAKRRTPKGRPDKPAGLIEVPSKMANPSRSI